MANRLCLQDQAELESTYGLPSLKGLQICLHKSSVAFAWHYQGKLGAVTGVAAENLLGSQACVWSFTSEVARRHPYAFYRTSKQVLAYFKTLYPYLYAVCDERYPQAQHYLQHLGARKTGSPFYLAKKDTQFQLYLFSNQSRRRIWEEQ